MKAYSIYKKIMNGITFVEKIVLAIVLTAVTVITFGNVLSRYVLPVSWSFTEELVINIFVLLSLLGAAVCARDEGGLVGMALLSTALPRKGQRILNLIGVVMGLIFAYVMIKYGFARVMTLIGNNKRTDVLRIFEWKFALFTPISGICMALHLIEFGIDNIVHLIKGEDGAATGGEVYTQ